MDEKRKKELETIYREELHNSRLQWIMDVDGAEVFMKAFPEDYKRGLDEFIREEEEYEKAMLS